MLSSHLVQAYSFAIMPIREPAVSRSTLLRTAATVWAAVGLFLIVRAALYYPEVYQANGVVTLLVGVTGLMLGIIKGIFVFAKLARRNVQRIAQLSPHKEKICVFAFQAWESYLIVAIMVTLGILLRLSPIARIYLFGIYLLIGVGLLIGSRAYMKQVI